MLHKICKTCYIFKNLFIHVGSGYLTDGNAWLSYACGWFLFNMIQAVWFLFISKVLLVSSTADMACTSSGCICISFHTFTICYEMLSDILKKSKLTKCVFFILQLELTILNKLLISFIKQNIIKLFCIIAFEASCQKYFNKTTWVWANLHAEFKLGCR